MTELVKVKERPILFSGPMVLAILQGRKTMTRRPMKPQPPEWIRSMGFTAFTPKGSISGRGNYKDQGPGEKFFKAPYGLYGDRLWVRETWAPCDCYDGVWHLHYPADDTCTPPGDPNFYGHHQSLHIYGSKKLRPSIHMPRWASRVLLEITSVRVERIQEITEADAMAEGVGEFGEGAVDADFGPTTPVRGFQESWNAIYPGSWDRNDGVWVIEFKRVAA